MITATSASAYAQGSLPPAAFGSKALGRDEFLRLLVTQLRNQDPLSPLQPHEFAAQLAQFASVEQLSQLNEGLAQQLAATHLNAIVGQTALSASLIGRSVVALGDQVEIPANGSGQIRAEVEGAGQATLRLFDAAGNVVAERDLGPVSGGRRTLDLPDDLPPGTYRYELTVTAADGSALGVTPYTSGVVDGVFFRDGEIRLRMGGLEVSLDALAEVERPLSPATAQP
jgi:flagellar basal-body rod modification protein FlgD